MNNCAKPLFAFLILIYSFAGPGPTAPGAKSPGGQLCSVRGRIEILNPKVKLKGGKADARDVVVWLSPLNGDPQLYDRAPSRRMLVQRNKRFVPHVMAVQVGTVVDFPNRDPFFHNVFSVFDGKPFDLGLYANGETRPVRFDRFGISFIYCNIHPQMSAVIVAVKTPYFAVSDRNGQYLIDDVLPGAYELHVWHERCDEHQLADRSRVVSVETAVTDLEVIRLDEAGYIAREHKNKNGEDYSSDPSLPRYARP